MTYKKLPYLPLPFIEATCNVCKNEMQVQVPEGVEYRNPEFDHGTYNRITAIKIQMDQEQREIETLIEVIKGVENLHLFWGKKKVIKYLEKKLQESNTYLTKMKNEHYLPLYNAINPSIGENSNS